MFRKLTGIFILLCFLLVKNSPLMILDVSEGLVSMLAPPATPVQSEDQENPNEQDNNQVPEENKSSKQLEYADEDFIYQSEESFIPVLALSKKLDHYYVKQVSSTYFSLPHPPPDCNS